MQRTQIRPLHSNLERSAFTTTLLCFYAFFIDELLRFNPDQRPEQRSGWEMNMQTSMRVKNNLLHCLCVSFLGGAILTSATAQTSTTITKQNVKKLTAAAQTPEEHERIAGYYRGEAQRLTAESQRYQKLAHFLDTQAKHGVSPSSATSYRQLAQQDARDAKECESLAAGQERVAKGLQLATEAKQ